MTAKHSKNYCENNRNLNMSNQKERIVNKKTNRKVPAFLKLIAFIYVVITIIFYISILKMDLIPTMYIVIFTIAEIIFTLSMVIGLVKRHKTYKITILCFIVALLISGIYIYVANYAFATINFLGNVFTQVEETEEYYVVVRKSSNYEKIENLEDETIYLFQVEDDVKEEIKDKVDITLYAKDDLVELGNSLIDGDVNAILVSSTQYNMLSEEIEDFKEETNTIYTAIHKIEVKTSSLDSENSKHTIENAIFNIYISGIDTSGNISNVARSDANIIATVNTNTHEILLTSIPRDYYVTLHGVGAKDKLTHSGIYGINETVTTVEDLLDIDINYYVRVNFTTVIKLVDTLDGIDVYSDYDFYRDGYTFNKGYNHVYGKAALVFSRERYSFADGDNQRVKNQQHVIEAIIKKVLNSTTILTKYTSILNSLEGSFQTNIEQDEISTIVKEQLNNMSSWTIKTNSLTGTASTASTYSMGSQQLSVMIPSSSSIDEAKRKIDEVLGE